MGEGEGMGRGGKRAGMKGRGWGTSVESIKKIEREEEEGREEGEVERTYLSSPWAATDL